MARCHLAEVGVDISHDWISSLSFRRLFLAPRMHVAHTDECRQEQRTRLVWFTRPLQIEHEVTDCLVFALVGQVIMRNLPVMVAVDMCSKSSAAKLKASARTCVLLAYFSSQHSGGVSPGVRASVPIDNYFSGRGMCIYLFVVMP